MLLYTKFLVAPQPTKQTIEYQYLSPFGERINLSTELERDHLSSVLLKSSISAQCEKNEFNEPVN